MNIQELQFLIFNQNSAAGWHDKPREKGTLMMLMVSEISEAMEAARKNLMDSHLPNRKGEEVELADAFIRILDYAGLHGFDIQGAVMEKLAYNATRLDHTRQERLKQNGKKF